MNFAHNMITNQEKLFATVLMGLVRESPDGIDVEEIRYPTVRYEFFRHKGEEDIIAFFAYNENGQVYYERKCKDHTGEDPIQQALPADS